MKTTARHTFVWDDYERSLFDAAVDPSLKKGPRLPRRKQSASNGILPQVARVALQQNCTLVNLNLHTNDRAAEGERKLKQQHSEYNGDDSTCCSCCSTRPASAVSSSYSSLGNDSEGITYEERLFADAAKVNGAATIGSAASKAIALRMKQLSERRRRRVSAQDTESQGTDSQHRLQIEELTRERHRLNQLLADAIRSIPSAPAYWTNLELRNLGVSELRCEWLEGSVALKQMLLRSALHEVCDGRDGTFCVQALRSVRVWRVENPLLWKQYQNKADELIARHELRCPGSPEITCPKLHPQPFHHHVGFEDGLPSRLKQQALNGSLNEAFLWHGSKPCNINLIVQQGFDERVTSPQGMLGAGLYFAEDSCKSGQYAAKDSRGSHWFILSRVLLGCSHHTRLPMPEIRRAPDFCDSVVFTPNHIIGHHREFVIYDRFQAYPEYIVEVKTTS